MRSFTSRTILPALIAAWLGTLGGTAGADPLTSFTLTDLGAGTPTFSTGASGGIVTVGSSSYAFQPTQDTTLNASQANASGIPLIDQAPINDPNAYGNPLNVYSIPLTASTNGQGTYIAIDAYGVNGHWGMADVYRVTKNPDGTWGSPVELWSGGEQFSGMAQAAQASITGINQLGEVLGTGSVQAITGGTEPSQAYLYNLNTNSLLNLSSLGVIQAGGWTSLVPVAIDDQGRILLEASPSPTSGDNSVQTLLLTPAGVSTDGSPVPEPGTLAIAMATMAALALRRAVRRKG